MFMLTNISFAVPEASDDDDLDYDDFFNERGAEDPETSDEGSEDDALEQAAQQIADAFASKWGPPLRGVRAIEGLGGADAALARGEHRSAQRSEA